MGHNCNQHTCRMPVIVAWHDEGRRLQSSKDAIKQRDLYHIERNYACTYALPVMVDYLHGGISNNHCSLYTRNHDECTEHFMNNGYFCACVQKGYSCIPDYGDGYDYMTNSPPTAWHHHVANWLSNMFGR